MKKINLMALLLLLAVTIVACGGAEPAPTGPQTVNLTIEAADISYDKTEIAVKEGTKVTIELKNVGALEHNWSLVSGDVDTTDPNADFAGNVVGNADTGLITGGESKSVSFIAPAAGEYKFVCTVPGHAIAGMAGTFTVEK